MANTGAIREGDGGLKLPLLVDRATGDAGLSLGIGQETVTGNTDKGTVPGAAGAGLGSEGAVAWERIPDAFKPFALATLTTEQLVWNPGPGLKVRVLGIVAKADVECVVSLIDGTGGATILNLPLAAGVPLHLPLGKAGILSAVANNDLYLESDTSADVAGTVYGVEE